MDLSGLDEGEEFAYEVCPGAWGVHTCHGWTNQVVEAFGVIGLDRVTKMFELGWQQAWERKL